ncbi:MAG: hypothetical protein RSF68_00240 [Myroides sp.]
MKKYLFLICFSMITSAFVQAQTTLNIPKELPTSYENSFTFPLGSKILIELKENTKGSYDYKVLEIEDIEGYYSLEDNKNIFDTNPKENTVELFFMGAYYNDGSKDSDWKTVLILRNNFKKHINYKADIKYYFNEGFENTSIVGAYPGTNTTEIWSHKIDYITLYDFINFR